MSLISQSCFCWLPWQQVQSMCGEQGQLHQLISELMLLNISTHNIQDKLTNIVNKTGLVFLLRLVRVCSWWKPVKKPGNTLRAEGFFLHVCLQEFLDFQVEMDFQDPKVIQERKARKVSRPEALEIKSEDQTNVFLVHDEFNFCQNVWMRVKSVTLLCENNKV